MLKVPKLKGISSETAIIERYRRRESNVEEALTEMYLAVEIQSAEAALPKTSELMGAVVDYAKARPVFNGYKAARYSKKFLAEHETEFATYRAARAAMNELLGGGKLPKMETLKKHRWELVEKEKALYAEYRQAQQDMRQAVAVKANIDHLLGLTDGRDNKEQTR